MGTGLMKYWLMKSEPSVYGIDNLQKDRQTSWGGVRNYQVRNMFRDDFAKGDLAFFYHSSCAQPGIVGTMSITRAGYADPAQFERNSEYFDVKSRRESPTWLAVDVRYKRRFPRTVTLEELRACPRLTDMLVLRRGNRLSVTPLTPDEAEAIQELASGTGAA
jgi:predicted RNA-binding protein with PUA-like domain